MSKKKELQKPYSGRLITPGVVALLIFVGVFAVLLMVVALIRGSM